MIFKKHTYCDTTSETYIHEHPVNWVTGATEQMRKG